MSLTEERIAIEVALLADKGDVTEEAVRLKTHLAHMEELLDSDDRGRPAAGFSLAGDPARGQHAGG
ncbi:MAG: endoribonuclease YicC domain-containing protein [Candidatus Hydrogenedentales bacterium]